MFEEVGIDLVGDAAIGVMRRPRGLGWAGLPGRGAWGRIVPEPAMLEDLAYDVALAGLDNGDDLHGPTAARATERVGVVDLFDQHGPSSSVERGGSCGRGGGLFAVLRKRGTGTCAGNSVPLRSQSPFFGLLGPHAPGLVGVVAVVADGVLAGVGDVLEDRGEEVERLKDLEVALDAREEFGASGVRESLGAVLLGAIDDLPVGPDADEAGEAEGAAGHVLGEAFDAVAVARGEADAAVDVEAAVAPGADLADDGGGDAVGVEQEAKDVVLPDSEERLVAEVGGQWNEAACGGERPVGDQGVDVGVVMDELPEGLDGEDGAGGGVLAEQGAVGLDDGLPGEGGKTTEQGTMVAEEDPQAFGKGPDELAMGDVQADVLGHVHAEQERAFLRAARADAALLAGEGDEELVAAVRAADAGEAVLEVTALEEPVDGLVKYRSPVAVLAGVPVGVDGAELVDVFSDEAVEVRFEALAWAVDIDRLVEETGHAACRL